MLFSYDLDQEAKCEAQKIVEPNFNFKADNYRNIHDSFLDNSIDGVLIDCGVSSPQLDDPSRGFSFKRNGPLDMRFNVEMEVSCADIINGYDESALAKILWEYGEERESKRIAKAIVKRRKIKKISETSELSDLICAVKRIRTKKHPATKTFQALRIEVNDEVNSLKDCLVNLKPKIKHGGRVIIISFHSLEDRIAKLAFKIKTNLAEKKIPLLDDKKKEKFKVSKVIYPSNMEINNNIRSRSAKMRIIEKI